MKQYWFVIITFLFLLALAMTDDFEREQEEYSHYCEMVELWNSNKHIPLEQRPGWPPYQGECDG